MSNTQNYRPKGRPGMSAMGWYGAGETLLNMAEMGQLYDMYWDNEAVQVSRTAIQARVFCDPFDVSVKGLGGKTQGLQKTTKTVISDYWMPTLPKVHDHINMFGLCPYIWKKIPQSPHVYPIVPDWGTYTITYKTTRKGTQFFLYWSDEGMPEKASGVFWVIGEKAPENGRFRSIMATLRKMVMMEINNLRACAKAAHLAANPFYVFENSPKGNEDLADYLTVEEAFGKKEVFKQMGDRNEIMMHKYAMQRNNFENALLETALGPHFGYKRSNPMPNWSPSHTDAYSDTHNEFLSRSIVMDPGFQVREAPRPAILMNMEQIWSKLSREAAALMGFPLEFAIPMSNQRSGNVQGNARFLNQNVKRLRADFVAYVRRMWLLSYGQLVFREARNMTWRAITKPSLAKEFKMNDQIDITIEWPCIPELSYEQLRQFHLDGWISHEDMACQAGGMFGFPDSIVNCKGGKLPEQREQELKEKQLALQERAQKAQERQMRTQNQMAIEQVKLGEVESDKNPEKRKRQDKDSDNDDDLKEESTEDAAKRDKKKAEDSEREKKPGKEKKKEKEGDDDDEDAKKSSKRRKTREAATKKSLMGPLKGKGKTIGGKPRRKKR